MAVGADTDLCRIRRTQSGIDIVLSVLLAMMLWPFPVGRAMLSPAVHVLGVLITYGVVQVLYYAVSAVAWRQTLGMRLVGVRLRSADGAVPARRHALRWGLVSAVTAPWYVVAPRSACTARTAERFSRTTIG